MAAPRTMVYQTFELTARPVLKFGKWTTQVRIRRNNVAKQFTSSETFDSEEEAVIHSLDFGRKIIDGEDPEVTGLWIS